MKLTTILFLFLSLTCRADWYKINASDKVVAFSKYAKPGKISVFIISAPWCGSCKVLEEDLHDAKLNMGLIDIYDVELTSPGNRLEQLKNTSAYNFWGKLESLTTLPRIYITTPTTNLVASFDDAGRDKNLYERIIRVINEIKENSRGFTTELLSQPAENFNVPISTERPKAVRFPKATTKSPNSLLLKAQIDSLEKVIVSKQDSISLMYSTVDSLNSRAEKFVKENEAIIEKYYGLRKKIGN